ncbi:MAG: LysR family transcriptional regulator [Rhizomicrobium sp.]|jgi:DNA-binding transcriptional LysR family regulator
MASAPPGWDLYRSFLAVVRHGSLSAAARALGLTQPTLGRHIAELESALGQKLFIRSQTGLAPAPAAFGLTASAEAMEASAASFLRVASGDLDEAKGSVRVTASEFIGVEVLPPILTAFRESHPGIAIELALSDANQDLSRRDADIAVRMARPTQAALVARRLGDIGIGLYVHRRYAARHGIPKTSGELAAHTLIGFDADAFGLRTLRTSGLPVSREVFAFRSDSEHARLAALRAGFGIGGCQDPVARRDPNLLAVLPGEIRFDLEMWLVMHEDLRASRRVRLVYNRLAEGLAVYAGLEKARKLVASGPRKPLQKRGKFARQRG